MSPRGAMPPRRYRFRTLDTPPAPPLRWVHEWATEGSRPWLSVGRAGGAYLLRFHDSADFFVDPRSDTIGVVPCASADPSVVRQLARGQVMPRAISLHDPPVLHASAVADADGRTIAFAGASGAGKSSMALRCCGEGFHLVSDDFLHLRQEGQEWRCKATARGVWLDEAAAAGVATASAVQPPEGPLTLAHVFVLGLRGGDAPPAPVPLRPRECLLELFRYCYRLDPTDPALLAVEFERLARLAGTVPVSRLDVPRGFGRFDEILARVREVLARHEG